MSKGPGIVQRKIIAAFEAEPAKKFTIERLAAFVTGMEERSQLHV